ncbi:Fur family transcriptional regulator [Agarilytica rhodophyticola]|uniref:Fur family transcriptional regulator n=1 Tax=Agarilytica rhodophyticola TaxID=1737490 RepID=UPI000B3413BA|nr:Fur family transcriptional regulator [Agarilytica rhodophyticola]
MSSSAEFVNNTQSQLYDNAAIASAIKRAKEICQINDVRLTQLREQVLVLILRHGKPLGAYSLMDMLEETSDRERVAPPTIYRTLDFLLEYRLIHKIHSLNAYVSNSNPRREESSVILICSDCGNAQEVPNNTIQQAINLSASQHRFSVRKQVIEITGQCSSCKQNGI